MKKFIKHIFIVLSASLIFFEIILRVFHLTNDVPRRKIENNLQTYKLNQEGYYKGAKWKVNDYGFLGFDDTSGGNNQVLLVGDSYVENMMNDLQCHIGFFLKENNLKVFELARSGMTFIEYLEFIKFYTPKIKQAKTFVLVNENDIYESISNIYRYSDRLQLNIKTGEIELVKLKAPLIKSIIYNFKSFYYLYSNGFFSFKFQKFNSISENKNEIHNKFVEDFFYIIEKKYDLSKIDFICYSMSEHLFSYFEKNKLNAKNISKFEGSHFREDDNHWTCLGNEYVSSLILNFFQK